MRSWFSIEGSLEPLTYDGPSFFRFPEGLAEMVLQQFSAEGAWVFDPFCGFGTTLVAAQRLGRQAIGFEHDPGRGAFAAARVHPPSRVIIDDVARARTYQLPVFDLLLTSPPYTTFRAWDDAAGRDLYCAVPLLFVRTGGVVYRIRLLSVQSCKNISLGRPCPGAVVL